MNELRDPDAELDERWNWYLCLALLANGVFWLLIGLALHWWLQ